MTFAFLLPVLVFHPTFLALASNEDKVCFKKLFEVIFSQTEKQPEYVLADGAMSITNAAEKVYPISTRLMCWAHTIRNIDKHLKFLPKTAQSEIPKDQFRVGN